jgi:hypothetical protein
MEQVVAGGMRLARRIAPVYAANPRVAAVMTGGSVARGLADRYSDLELGIFWADPPPDAERLAAIETLGGALFGPRSFRPYATDPEWVVSEHFRLDAVEIDGRRYAGTSNINTQHFTVGAMERCLDDVLERYDLAPEKHELLSAVACGLPLHGAGLINHWQARAAAYPAELARRVVREHLWFGPAYVPECFAGRGNGGDVLILYRHVLDTAHCILEITAALNRVYYPSPQDKWMDWIAARCAIAPADLAPRLKTVFRAPPAEGCRLLRALIYDALDLVDRHLPQANESAPDDARRTVSTDWARRRFADPPWDGYTLMCDIGARSTATAMTAGVVGVP